MKKILINLLIGLPGAGKSTYLHNNVIKSESNYLFDDMSQIKSGMKELEEKLHNENINTIYISDVNFCEERILHLAMNKIKNLNPQREINFSFIIFHSNENISKNNVIYRNDGRYVLPTIKRFAPEIEKTITYINNNIESQNIEHIYTPLMPLSSELKNQLKF